MNTDPRDPEFLQLAVEAAAENIRSGAGGPFGAVIVREGTVIARGTNLVVASSDPTAHAEVVAIRRAAALLQRPHLDDCTLYASCEPCPMCLASAMWARIGRVVYAQTRGDAAAMGFDDAAFYEQFSLPADLRRMPVQHIHCAAARHLEEEWNASPHRRLY